MKRRFFKNEKGQAMVEFAIVLPLLLLILCGILDFGWIYFNKYKVEDATYQGARFAFVAISRSTDPTADDTTIRNNTANFVRQGLPGNGANADVTVTITADTITVDVENRVNCLTIVGQTFLGRTYNAQSTSVAAR
ncbi:MAG: pilus assembly protein [Eubacterium sp.]|nr:pilus assembly protein [Eubacterium sp.]